VALSGQKNILWSSLMMTLSIVSKMLTLVLIPFMPRKLYWGKVSLFAVFSLLMSIIIFWYSFGGHSGWIESVKLWFNNFEFNASIYYIIRGIGYLLEGYNIIQKAGPTLALITMAGIGIIWWFYIRKPSFGWATAMLSVLTVYFLMSTTVHPWYLGTLLALSVISLHRYPVVWTCLVFLSYSHYQGGEKAENYWLIATEYILLFSWMILEWRLGKQNELLAKKQVA
jgi:hypothetical protein